MAKIPYLVRRKNVFYFRLGVPADLREIIKTRKIFQSLRTQDSDEAARRALKLAAHFKTLLHDLKTGKTSSAIRFGPLKLTSSETIQDIRTQELPADHHPKSAPSPETRQAPLLSVVVDDFLNRYDQNNKATFTKLSATLPLLIELITNKPINQILQADLNGFFDNVQKLPVKRKQKAFANMTIREIIAANEGQRCIAAGTFESTYKACLSIFISWAQTNYRDQGFPSLRVDGAIYRGDRIDGINKQRAATSAELQKLFNNPKMRQYATNLETEHYFWLPALGLYTGARINELCQLNPAEDIKQDLATGIHYLLITDESATAEGVDKSIKTNSSKRVVPIHSKLIELGFLNYANGSSAQTARSFSPHGNQEEARHRRTPPSGLCVIWKALAFGMIRKASDYPVFTHSGTLSLPTPCATKFRASLP
ncbi:DUF6538 domain-containing protein [Methylomonas sp. DH-1]|uniref:DUF6538 domain-containing protein n=1 Tax=Methylomonas sp. (strain DH-1) TaxID=1727196 RepID=UPI0007C931B0|nr:DUF6538 domain-containing protein [Methylomonas sp. DH-1]ANE55771.1 hypothetical protein AYM39_11665 [Methylomonas sp. DH-1]